MNDDQKQDFVRKEDVEALVKTEVDRKLQGILRDEISKEVGWKYGHLKWFVSTIALVGMSALGLIGYNLVYTIVDAQMNARVGKVTDSLELMRFLNIAQAVDYKKGIPRVAIDEVMRFLRQAEKENRIRDEQDFRFYLYNIVHNFVSSDMTAEIDEIFKLYESEVLQTPELVHALLHHYGQAITVRSFTPEHDEDIALKSFIKLERAGRKQYPHVSLYYRLLFTFSQYLKKETSGTEHIKKLIDESKMLNLEGKAWFIYNLMLRTRAANWQDNPNSIGTTIEPIAYALLHSYGKKLETALGTDPDVFSHYLSGNPDEAKAEAEKKAKDMPKIDRAKVVVDKFIKNQPKPLPPALQEGFRPY